MRQHLPNWWCIHSQKRLSKKGVFLSRNNNNLICLPFLALLPWLVDARYDEDPLECAPQATVKSGGPQTMCGNEGEVHTESA